MPVVLLMALMAGAVAVDMGHLYVVQAELQTAADSAALNGAAALFPSSGSAPNWSAAQSAATSAVGLNASDSVTLHDGSIQSGYWNVSGSPAGMQATTIVPGNNDTAAVQVTVSRAPGLNGGPVSYFLAPLFGMKNGPVSATSVAMVSGPGLIAAGGLFPMAISKCMVQNFLNTGPSVAVLIGDGGTPPSTCPSTASGQWTNLGTGTNGASTVQNLMNSSPVSINDLINLVTDTGVKASLYKDVKQNANLVGATVVVPVINDASSTVPQQVVGFAAFHITGANWQSNKKYITGYFVPGYKIPTTGNGQVGPYYGAYLPARLAK
ncbi:hypothetical protein AWB83_06446 [Caballeronia ptereochthonis]|uniref:DUF2134 domain-containing protein n=2 Tax=Caballeronia ptereochthonis TaxID=1777144 RepID=A0A158E406_9BURK|nr:TadG family pilus assembly protein [Caballeronia ptereochthonis]SAL01631.1 hypothetical protein AWB83_06446 [Caballeronia ptereochthonis]